MGVDHVDQLEFWEDVNEEDLEQRLEDELKDMDDGKVSKLLFMSTMHNSKRINRLERALKYSAPIFVTVVLTFAAI